MYNISVVFTRHDELGKCNSDELFKIFESIIPDLIFEEIPPSYFDRYYKNKERRNLESEAISKFSEIYKVIHHPVDSDEIPSDSFFDNYYYLHRQIEGLIDINGFNYRNFTDSNKANIETYGFAYLNSVYSDNANDNILEAVEGGLQKISDEKLHLTYKLWKEINEKRENVMLRNIYNYSKENRFNKAIFTIGAGHRKSLMQRIQEFQGQDLININWSFYGN